MRAVIGLSLTTLMVLANVFGLEGCATAPADINRDDPAPADLAERFAASPY